MLQWCRVFNRSLDKSSIGLYLYPKTIPMRKTRALTLFMAIWMVLASSASAAVSVCRAPCCLPKLMATAQAKTVSGHCGSQKAADDAEAAAFFAEEASTPSLYAQNVESDGCRMHSSVACVAELAKTSEYLSHPTTVGLDIPAEALTLRGVYPTDPINHPENSASFKREVGETAGPPIFLSVSRFSC